MHIYICIITHTQSSLFIGRSIPLADRSNIVARFWLEIINIHFVHILINRHTYTWVRIQLTHTQSSLFSGQSIPLADRSNIVARFWLEADATRSPSLS